MDLRPAQILRADFLAGRRLHQRRPAEEDRPGPLDNDRLVAHRRDIGSARRAGAHHHGDLRDPARRHPRLIVEDPPEVLPIGEDVGLERQECPARIDEVEAGQMVLGGDLLGAQVLLNCQRVVGATLDRGIIGDDHHLLPGDDADPGDDPRAGGLAVVHPPGGERAELQKRCVGICQAHETVAHG